MFKHVRWTILIMRLLRPDFVSELLPLGALKVFRVCENNQFTNLGYQGNRISYFLPDQTKSIKIACFFLVALSN